MSPACDPLAGAAIRFGHRMLLDTLREFGLLGPDGSLVADEETLRGAAAFLRHELLRFARDEERLLGPGTPEHDSASFEHAFLAAEIDAFAREVDRLRRIAPLDGAATAAARARVLRRIHRIEAILELHVEKTEEADVEGDQRPC